MPLVTTSLSLVGSVNTEFVEVSKASGSKPAVTTTAIPQDFGIHMYTSKEVEGQKDSYKNIGSFGTPKFMICKDRCLTLKNG